MFSPVKNTKVYEQVIEQIKTMVKNGDLKKGDKLPTERDMAEQLKVSRASVREAIRALEVVGLVESRQGAGNYIKESFEKSLFEPLSIMFMLEESSPMEIYELRQMIEMETSKLAARQINDMQLLELKNIIDKLKNSTDEKESVKLDKAFHHLIAKAAKNTLILNISEVLSQLIDEFIKDSRKNILANSNNKLRLINLHEKVYTALKERDSDKAYQIIKEHFILIKECMDKK